MTRTTDLADLLSGEHRADLTVADLLAATGPGPVPPPLPAVPTPLQVSSLQAVRDDPCVSLLMTTAPARRMRRGDVARLWQLAVRARDRLRSDDADEGREELWHRLERTVELAAGGPATAALAVFVSAGRCEVVHLPLAVRDRVVLDPTFATRDLVRALHHTPRHVVLVLTAHEARLFHGVAGVLHPLAPGRFPVRDQAAGSDRRDGPRGPRTGKEEAVPLPYLRTVDAALGGALRLHPAPLVLVGQERLLARFRRISRHLDRLAGTITGGRADLPLPELAALVRPVLDEYLHSRRDEALRLLDRRVGAHRAVSGLADAWFAARWERPEMLLVEDTFTQPARLDGDGDLLVPVEDAEAPDVLDDAVDELIELVLQRGGWVALAGDGELSTHGRVALTLRSRD